ncbi:hypothetical protein [Massilia sp. NR 4-1]|uniref:hypothetical protein n=1 Tax=Massilia sp. NR 4-1 TaxID=1678028 RepID=UPI00067B7CB7|nr:hypothetical protein [Massilia sp. NR 4-1]AKU21416.1 hypothetical protein ACZ75_07940 [Massilia sp. NR 4-1]
MPIYVQHEVLGRIPDVFNAESIWQTPGLALFARRPLLRDLLERCPREQRGRAATRCFSHVALALPQEDVDDDYHLTRGARARELAATLASLHQKDFGDLLGSDEVRYDVMGSEHLAAGEIEVRFGHAVYLPASGEKALFMVSASRDSAVWKPVCPVYANQRLVLLGGENGPASCAVQGWPFGGDGAILLLNDGPDAPPVLHMRPKDVFDCSFDAANGYYVIKSARGGGGPQGQTPRLLLKITPTAAATRSAPPAGAVRPGSALDGANDMALQGSPRAAAANHAGGAAPEWTAARAAVWQARAGRPDNPEERTAAPLPSSQRPAPVTPESDATYAPKAQQRLVLAALALPRLSRYRDTGATALQIPFDSQLALAPVPGNGNLLTITVSASDEMFAITEAGRQRINAPAKFSPVDGRSIELLPAAGALADRYCALLALPHAASAAIAGGARFIFGRGMPALSTLRVLDSPRYLRCGEPSAAPGQNSSSPDRIGLSRNAFSFEASAKGLLIGRLSSSQALYHLDEKLHPVARIDEAAGDAPYLLPPGHHLVAGHYVLRYEA